MLTLALLTTLAAPPAGGSMFRHPDISDKHIVFVYGNDMWRAPREGGAALPLASPSGVERSPRFSPDGTEVAFVGNYDGGRDLYVIPIHGGIPHRVTHHPAGESLSDWTTTGDLLFAARGMGDMPMTEEAWRVDSEGGLPEQLPVPWGSHAAINRTGTQLAYTPTQRDGSTWKRYRGGMASDIWRVDLGTGESKRITDWEGTDTIPMWHGEDIFYLSDAGDEHRLNLWKYDTSKDAHRQLTKFKDFDVKWPAIGPDDDGPATIVFQHGPNIKVYHDRSGIARTVDIDVPGATASIRPQLVDVSSSIKRAGLSPTSKRVAAEARGDIWTLPAEKGSPRNLTRSSGVAERSPAWSPDGKWIAYFSDEPGEYELFIRTSDGSDEPRRLTSDMGPFKNSIWWMPNSESLLYGDKTGTAYRVDVDNGNRTKIGWNPYGAFPQPSFSHDSRWIAWGAGDEHSPQGRVHLHDTESGDTHIVTDSMFSDTSPAFDRAGEYLYFASNRHFQPSYSSLDLDTTWIYNNSGVLIAVPLREDVDHPWLEESDEEEWTDDEDSDEEDESKDDSEDESKDDGEDEDENSTDQSSNGHANPITGTWDIAAASPGIPPMDLVLKLTLHSDDTVTGTMTSDLFKGTLEGTWDAASKTLSMHLSIADAPAILVKGTVIEDTLEGTASAEGSEDFVCTGTRRAIGEKSADSEDTDDDDNDDVIEIDLNGFEARGFRLPVSPGQFGNLAVNHKNQLMYTRNGDGIKVFDLSDDDAEEQSAGSGSYFSMSGDGKKILVGGSGAGRIRKAGAGSGGDRVVTDPMLVSITPRDEWRQVVNDAWRIQRDYFYEPTMHGVDWEQVREDYLPMVDHAMTRSDVNYIIGEMIGELNIGHAYNMGVDNEDEPHRSVGMLGVDWELATIDPQEWAAQRTQVDAENQDEDDAEEDPEEDPEDRDYYEDLPDAWPRAYRVARTYGGGQWDIDARDMSHRQGLELDEGDFVLAVNGAEIDPTLDPWTSFIGTAGRPVTLTVSDKPVIDDDAREVVIKPRSGDRNLRYRDWIESNRATVDALSNGDVGYIYVPNTGRNGQSDLIRQFYGQAHKKALIVDDRWNGGGQIPTRFIELLNRPVTNYWRVRDGKDWSWPPDSHQGPKAMLINGNAGSGGDMFPWLFRHNDLGPIIGTRTWGGLVGISGNPGLIDGGYVSVPTFGFYETDGTWGVEGHGVDPDIEVLADPALMREGGDPQLERAVAEMLAAIADHPYTLPQRPASPDRSGMGMLDQDK